MIAADRRRIGARALAASRRVDRLADRCLERAYPPLRRAAALAAPVLAAAWVLIRRAAALTWRGARPALVVFFRALAASEAGLRAGGRSAAAAATAVSAVLTPRRMLAASIFGAGAALVASQFLAYHGVQIGQPGYAGLPQVVAAPPAVDVQRAGSAHAWALVPVGALGMLCGVLALGRRGSRAALAATVLGAAALALILIVDLHKAHEVGGVSARFAAAHAVLRQGFYAELAAAAALLGTGLLYYARPCLIRISSSGRAASGRRRRPRRRASSRARVARSA